MSQVEFLSQYPQEMMGLPFAGNVVFGGERIGIYSFATEAKRYIELHKDPQNVDDMAFLKNEGVYSLLIKEAPEFSIDFIKSQNVLMVSGNIELIMPELDFICYVFSEVARQEKGKFTIHAAAVSDGEEGILILGNKGVGKTALAMALCKWFGYKIIGNDVLIIGSLGENIGIYSGDRVFRPRRIVADKYFPELKSFFPPQVVQSRYDDKVTINPSALGVQVENHPVKIKRAMQVFLEAEGQVPLVVSDPPALQFRLNLMENATRYIRTVGTPMLGANLEYRGYFPSLDLPELYTKRANVLERLVQEIGVKSISGSSLNELAKFLAW